MWLVLTGLHATVACGENPAHVHRPLTTADGRKGKANPGPRAEATLALVRQEHSAHHTPESRLRARQPSSWALCGIRKAGGCRHLCPGPVDEGHPSPSRTAPPLPPRGLQPGPLGAWALPTSFIPSDRAAPPGRRGPSASPRTLCLSQDQHGTRQGRHVVCAAGIRRVCHSRDGVRDGQ